MRFTDSTEPDPPVLRTDEFTLRPITAGDTEMDYAAVMDTREDLRLWEQGTWPEDDFTVEDNRVDIVEMEERHIDLRAFSYTVLDPDGTSCLGCVYVFPTGASFLAKAEVTPVGDDRWEDVDAVVYFWVRRPPAADRDGCAPAGRAARLVHGCVAARAPGLRHEPAAHVAGGAAGARRVAARVRAARGPQVAAGARLRLRAGPARAVGAGDPAAPGPARTLGLSAHGTSLVGTGGRRSLGIASAAPSASVMPPLA